jgi:hypothetical protein
MDARTVRDVLGDPESWPNSLNGEHDGTPNMQGAKIWDVIASGDEIAVHTKGGIDGPTFSVFVIEDENLREQMLRALILGSPVHEVVAAAL